MKEKRQMLPGVGHQVHPRREESITGHKDFDGGKWAMGAQSFPLPHVALPRPEPPSPADSIGAPISTRPS